MSRLIRLLKPNYSVIWALPSPWWDKDPPGQTICQFDRSYRIFELKFGGSGQFQHREGERLQWHRRW